MKFLLLILSSLIPLTALAAEKVSCSNNWTVTGYFTPIESDYSRSSIRKIKIRQLGVRRFASAFLTEVRMEGWGKTNEGWYLGYYGKQWHKSYHPLNALGTPLVWGAMATDKKVIRQGGRILIPTLPGDIKDQVFLANDVGSAIRGKHVDIYTGEGRSAEDLTYELTGKRHLVCRLLTH